MLALFPQGPICLLPSVEAHLAQSREYQFFIEACRAPDDQASLLCSLALTSAFAIRTVGCTLFLAHCATPGAGTGFKTRFAKELVNKLSLLGADSALRVSPGILFSILLGRLCLEEQLAITVIPRLSCMITYLWICYHAASNKRSLDLIVLATS